jgi:hypothetical protein
MTVQLIQKHPILEGGANVFPTFYTLKVLKKKQYALTLLKVNKLNPINI